MEQEEYQKDELRVKSIIVSFCSYRKKEGSQKIEWSFPGQNYFVC